MDVAYESQIIKLTIPGFNATFHIPYTSASSYDWYILADMCEATRGAISFTFVGLHNTLKISVLCGRVYFNVVGQPDINVDAKICAQKFTEIAQMLTAANEVEHG